MRPESLYFLFSPVTRIKGIGSETAKALARLLPPATAVSGATQPIVRDLLFHLPVGIVDRRATFPLNAAPDDTVATFVVTVDEHIPPKQKRFGKQPYKVICSNETGSITLVFFHAREDYINGALPVGAKRVISGRTEHFDFRLQMTHPDIIAPVDKLAEVQKPEPVYPLTVGLTSRRIAKIVDDALGKLPELPEWLMVDSGRWPVNKKEKDQSTVHCSLPTVTWKSALAIAHHPESEEDLSPLSPSRMRLAYDEMLANQLHLAMLRRNMQQQPGEVIKGTGELTQPLIASLPFALTKGQLQAIDEISADLASGRRMGRLLQGDVGSGKTIVALIAMLKAAEQGLQSAFMVPTELIAQQHFEVINGLVASIPSPLEGEGQGGGYTPSDGENGRGYTIAAAANARSMRMQATPAEKKLWEMIRDSQCEDYKFRRQQSIGPYIVDFFCHDAQLIIELDGGHHAKQQADDVKREAFLIAKGYRILRFWNNEVMENPEAVYDKIITALNAAPERTPHPTLPLKGGGLSVILLTGSVKGAARKEALEKIASGEAKIIIGTHALFQDAVEFRNLALVVVDEQHRFGVNQRMALSAKGNAPHVLHMTATPIPRSLTMTLYGDMDISQLTEKPAERQPITTRLIPASRYDEVVSRLKAALDRGEKAYWICPLIESSEFSGQSSEKLNSELYSLDTDIAAATSRHTEFTARFGPIVGLVHGRMKGEARHTEMQKFAEGKTKLLVATTVVEVGVDVRDATIIVIEQAERFGLAQLHQLRGRVGRGDKASACVLLYSEGGQRQEAIGQSESLLPNATSLWPRLSILRDTEDGFKIAEADLAQRGGGDLLGTRQSGLPRFIFTDLFEHRELLKQAREEALHALKEDPDFTSERGRALKLLLELFGHGQETALSAALSAESP